jgi:hypothetical protein
MARVQYTVDAGDESKWADRSEDSLDVTHASAPCVSPRDSSHGGDASPPA